MDPGVRGSGRGTPRAVGCRPHRPWGALRTSRIPCSTPSVAQGARWKLWSGALTRLDRRYRPGLRLAFSISTRRAAHPLEVARQRLQVDGKPHPTAPSHPQAPKPVGALQLGVCPLYPGPYGIPLAPLFGGLPLDVHLHQGLEDVGPRTPVQLHRATGPQGGVA